MTIFLSNKRNRKPNNSCKESELSYNCTYHIDTVLNYLQLYLLTSNGVIKQAAINETHHELSGD